MRRFRIKKDDTKTVQYWQDEVYMSCRTLDFMNILNESQRRLKKVDGGEYQKQLSDISAKVKSVEESLGLSQSANEEEIFKL